MVSAIFRGKNTAKHIYWKHSEQPSTGGKANPGMASLDRVLLVAVIVA